LDELLGYFSPGTRFESPELSLLGSSLQSGIWAAELGLPYVFADFINAEGAPSAAYYRQHFQPSERLQQPRVGVCVWAICADSDEAGQRLSASFRMMMTLLRRNQFIAVPTVETAQAFLEKEGIGLEMPPGRRVFAGAPHTVRAGIEAVAAEYGAEEVLLVNILYDHAARRRSYELIAAAFGLKSG
jgi:alkanesulfonate monooxygenase SsuD/methylene tetrahydromethanopterin reductase-like flavin-dependent oxidoreductase (luciferase family)